VSQFARRLVGLTATAAIVVVVSGCGNSVPTNAVARVGDATITKESFGHWLEAAARSSQPPGTPSGQIIVPDPPEFTECVTAAKAVPVPKGAPEPTDAQLKTQCKQQYDLLRQQVMAFLLQAEAITQEAEERDVSVSDAEVQTQFEEVKAQTFPKPEEYTEFLETSGRSEEDLLFQTRLDLLSERLREDVVADAPEPTTAEIQTYYEENGEQPPIGEPETRDLMVILTEDEAEAERARNAIESGRPFAAVAEQFSIDEVSKQNDAKLEDVAEGQQEPALDEAVFSAERGELIGPIETQFGWYVFEVTGITPGSKESLEDARPAIIELLTQQRDQELLNTFVEEFQERAEKKTTCAKGFEVQGCSNAPEPPSTTSGAPAAPGGTPAPSPTPPPAGPPAEGSVPPPESPPAPQSDPNAPPSGADPSGGAE